jgi:hypothetical protein
MEQLPLVNAETSEAEMLRAFVQEQLGAFNFVRGWQNGGVHIRGCLQTTYRFAPHSDTCEKAQKLVPYLTQDQVDSLPVSGHEFARNGASEY